MKLNLRRKVFALNSKCVKCNSTTNLQTLCAQCNLKKGNKFESQLSQFNGDAKL